MDKSEQQKPVILLVDDNETHRYALSRHLTESGFEMLVADHGTKALEMAHEQQPAAILLDIHLPDMLGFEICERLKQNPVTRDIPVIFHSATYDTQQAKSHAMDLGAVSFLSYPINIEHLVSVLRGTLSQHRTQSGE